MTESQIEIKNLQDAIALFGSRDENVNYLRETLDVKIMTIDSVLTVSGEEDNVVRAVKVLEILLARARSEIIRKPFMDFIIDLVDSGEEDRLEELTQAVASTIRGKAIRCQTYRQAQYVRAIKRSSIVFGIGPAGTGKTYLAVALAVLAYKNKQVDKIILTRPAVEAGEKLGFLPGDLGAKVDPYLRPLYDALQEFLGLETYARMLEKGAIEIAPLAYMRGRTLSNAFIILDEAQNTTREQMKMFLTRMGEGSKIVVTGDATQIDLPVSKSSGLLHAAKILRDVRDIEIVYLTARDVVRHDLVQAIVAAYERGEGREETPSDADKLRCEGIAD